MSSVSTVTNQLWTCQLGLEYWQGHRLFSVSFMNICVGNSVPPYLLLCIIIIAVTLGVMGSALWMLTPQK
jgi:hypothetical protein